MLLGAERLTKQYGTGDTTVPALRDVSLRIQAGEFVAIMGPSGSGKSTLMNLIGLLDRPTSGKLYLAGEDTTALSHDRLAQLRNSQIGFVFQAYNLLPRHSALENVEVPLVYARMPRRKRLALAKDLLATVGLLHRSDHPPAQLSGGEQQRVAIARALACNPAIILADEPTGALDSRTGMEVLALMQSLNRLGRTIVLVTHDESVASHAGRIIRIRDGLVECDEANFSPHDAAEARQVVTRTAAPEREISAA
jgi:putative ABC transport system ATP-binding protein